MRVIIAGAGIGGLDVPVAELASSRSPADAVVYYAYTLN